ncbi:MAG: LOG family protein [Deltaproteobacteria bacterium]|nr:LOG family protein [Deltaproteobacteria bacterium]MBW2419752.1 LOG family protein [Deltaproteobacteria bacterium]
MSPRRYQLRDSELNEAVESLVERTQQIYGERAGADFVRQMLVTGVRLLRDGAGEGDLKLINSALKELRHSLRVFAPYEHHRKVAVFGSARTAPESGDWKQARAFAERIVEAGWMVITGAGGGIMAAAQGGAGREASFGVNIRLPFEQEANPVIANDPKLINFRYFFTRKVVFVKESHAIALFPGGYGTHDEGLETLTLIQTGKGEILPVVFVDEPGGSYWRDWEQYVHSHLSERGFISEEDLDLFTVTDDVDVAVKEILNFYSNYHSSRFVGDELVMRVRVAPDSEQLDALNSEFPDILTSGAIGVGAALAGEGDEVVALPRVCLRFNRRNRGRLRVLIDRINDLVKDEASPPIEASPHEIFPLQIPDDARNAEDSEG